MKQFRNTPYFVTNTGLVYRQGSNKPLKPDTTGPYLRVTLCMNGNTQRHCIHRMVAECYILNPLNKPQVNHKDLNKLNNHVDNLEWVTVSENTTHAYLKLKGISWGNIKGSNQASKNRYKETHNKFSNLLGEYFVEIVHVKPSHKVKFKCPNCATHMITYTNSTRFTYPLSLLCKPCKKQNKLNEKMKI